MQGKKTIDIREGNPHSGLVAFFQSDQRSLRFRIVKKESGQLEKILRLDNYKAVIPSALGLVMQFDYFQRIYGVGEGIFTAYYIEPLFVSEKG